MLCSHGFRQAVEGTADIILVDESTSVKLGEAGDGKSRQCCSQNIKHFNFCCLQQWNYINENMDNEKVISLGQNYTIRNPTENS